MAGTKHLTKDRSVEYTLLANREMIVYEGDYGELVEFAATLRPGMKVERAPASSEGGGDNTIAGSGDTTTGGSGTVAGSGTGGALTPTGGTADGVTTSLPEGSADDAGGEYGFARIASANVVRGNGGTGKLSVLVTQNVHACVIAVDFCEVSKSVLTWHADVSGGAPDLAKIAEWRQQEQDDPEAYAGLKIGDTPLDGPTQKLARMIRDGIESYPVHLPMVTITATLDEAPYLSSYPLDAVGEPETPYGWKDTRGRTVTDVVNGMVTDYQWIRTVARATPNPDGTYQFVQAWQAATSIDKDLYGLPEGGGANQPEGGTEG